MRFEDTLLNDNILDALYDMRFETCTPIQERCIPEILNGRDVMGIAQTGTGKTAAYLLPVLSMLDDGKATFPDGREKTFPRNTINCLVMSPTRELAQQIDQAMQGFGYYLDGIGSVAVYGGNDGGRYDTELKSLRLGADVVIATPGRLISHINLGNADLSKVSFFILDEADRMLDMGFYDDIMTIAKQLPADCQTAMFSATMPDKIGELTGRLLKNPVQIRIAVSKPAEKIRQSICFCKESQKTDIIRRIFSPEVAGAEPLRRVIIFCGSKVKAKQVNRILASNNLSCGEMHSDLQQAERDEMMFRFKSGQIDVIVATDIISRGIDIDDIAMVINYDVPRDAEDYVHRIGRTARADKDGVAITLVSPDDKLYLRHIEKLLGKRLKVNTDLQPKQEPDNKEEGKNPRKFKKNTRKKKSHQHKVSSSRKDEKPTPSKQ